MEVPTPLVLYVDPPLMGDDEICKRLARRPRNRINVIPLALDALPRYAHRERLASLDNFLNADPVKDSVLFQIVMCSKFDLLRDAMQRNPYGTEFFAWMDAGLFYVARPPEVFPTATSGVAFLQMCAVSPLEAASAADYYAGERGRLAAGFFRGSAKRLEMLAQAFSEELDAALTSGLRTNEQMILSRLSVLRPDLFEFYYGDYSSILCNWDRIRDGLGVVFMNLAYCREHGLWASSKRICEALEASQDGLDPEAEARWLDEYFISAWYNADPERSRSVAARLLTRAQQTAWFRAHEHRIRRNLSFLET